MKRTLPVICFVVAATLCASVRPSSAQTYRPAIEYQSFMQMRFYENQGAFLVEDLEVVFPPAGSRKATFVVSRAGGGVVASVPLRLETPLATYATFGMYKPDGVPGNARVGEPGDYVLSSRRPTGSSSRRSFTSPPRSGCAG